MARSTVIAKAPLPQASATVRAPGEARSATATVQPIGCELATNRGAEAPSTAGDKGDRHGLSAQP